MSKKQRRNCLKCDKNFPSEGHHNRLCAHCNWYINKFGYVNLRKQRTVEEDISLLFSAFAETFTNLKQ